MSLQAVVMAAGEGRRLRPLTERWPKAVLPIDGRPVLAVLLRDIATAGVGEATVVVGHLAEQVEALAGDGSGFGLVVRYARQREPRGSGDAVRCALAAGARPPLLALAADTVFSPGDVGRAAARWVVSGAAGGLGVRTVRREELAARSSVRVEGGRVLEVVEKPAIGLEASGARQVTHRAGAPLWCLDEELAASLADLPGPPFELSVAFQRAIDAGREVAALELSPTRDLTAPEDIVRHNFPYLSRERWSPPMSSTAEDGRTSPPA